MGLIAFPLTTMIYQVCVLRRHWGSVRYRGASAHVKIAKVAYQEVDSSTVPQRANTDDALQPITVGHVIIESV